MLASPLLRNSPDRTFESLYKRHVKDVYRYSLTLLHRQADAEDATQTAFMNAYRALGRGERPRDAGKWLRAITLNVCREHYRRAGRRPDEVSLDDDPAELVLDPPTPTIGDVVRGLAVLPFNQRAALVMREFEGRSVADVAEALEVSPSAVEALLFRARRALREQLEDQLTCAEAEQTISRQLDGALPRGERGPLRAHLRSCQECASLARRLRAQRSAIRSLGLLPIPASFKLGKLAEGGALTGSAAGAGQSAGGSLIASLVGSAAAKVAVLAAVGAAAVGVGVGYESLQAKHPAAQGSARRGASLVRTPIAGAAGHRVTPASPIALLSAAGLRASGHAAPARSQPRRSAGAPTRLGTRAQHPRPSPTPAVSHHAVSGAGQGEGGSPANPGRGHGVAKPQSPGQSGAAHGVGHGYGHSKPKHAAPTPTGHAYGRTKAKPGNPAPAAQSPAPAPGQAKLPGSPAVGKGHQKQP